MARIVIPRHDHGRFGYGSGHDGVEVALHRVPDRLFDKSDLSESVRDRSFPMNDGRQWSWEGIEYVDNVFTCGVIAEMIKLLNGTWKLKSQGHVFHDGIGPDDDHTRLGSHVFAVVSS